MWYDRHLQNKLLGMARNFKIVMIVGARQVGKSSLLAHLFPHLTHITFDPYNDQYGAKTDPDLFLKNFRAPLILDEVQYTPELLSSLKRFVDRSPQKGQYFLTGSQNFSLLKNAAESLAGRVGILEMNGLTYFERQGQLENHWLISYLTTPSEFYTNLKTSSQESIYDKIWAGQLPALTDVEPDFVADYLGSYIQTYLQRDVRVFENIEDMDKFTRFLGLCAAMTGHEVNDSEFGRELGISSPTIKRWRTRLATSYQWREILPYYGNAIKRLSKKPKGYFCDTGLACYLQRIPSPLALTSHPNLGHLFESYCAGLIATLCSTLSPAPRLYHWRTNGGAEVDIILDYNGFLYPIEIKCKTAVSKKDASGIAAFRQSYPTANIAPGILLYTGDYPLQISEDCFAVPWKTATAELLPPQLYRNNCRFEKRVKTIICQFSCAWFLDPLTETVA
ncbi:MAG: GTP-binding protein [Alphaproteobacteria bacterium]|nr:GTP-binding protein [Alphaproteobacteria bacterium]